MKTLTILALLLLAGVADAGILFRRSFAPAPSFGLFQGRLFHRAAPSCGPSGCAPAPSAIRPAFAPQPTPRFAPAPAIRGFSGGSCPGGVCPPSR